MKFIFVYGGVMSGVGKGVVTSSIAKILSNYGYDVTCVKIDPYINFDAGTMNPIEHGEVFVTYDGGETDQDIGNYERFLNKDISKRNNITTGQIYKKIIDDERSGKYLGKTVEFIPHVPNEIINRIMESSKGHDVSVVEIGGTIGDFENIPFLFSSKRIELMHGKENVIHILVTYLPIPKTLGEMKTKPTQHAIMQLNSYGIVPDFIITRSERDVDDRRKEKIAKYSNILSDHIISCPNVDTIYYVPLKLIEQGFDKKLISDMKLPMRESNWSKWKKLVDNIRNSKKYIDVAVVGKYIGTGSFVLYDSYISVKEALIHAGANLGVGVRIHWLDSKKDGHDLSKYDGIIVPGGFGSSGVEGKINAIKFARENDVPYLGLCYGMQLAVVEYARNVLGWDAHTTEIEKTSHPVIDILPEQKELMEEGKYGGTMRLGEYVAVIKEGTLVHSLYKNSSRIENDSKKIENYKKTAPFRVGITKPGDILILEKHRHRYEVNPKFVDDFEKSGLSISGVHRRHDGINLVEFIEIPKNKFFIGTQAHPELKSRLEDPSPLFVGFVKVCAGL